MGLLTKAAGKTVPELDEMGKALLDRIRRLPPRKTTPYTALSLLKAYGSFQVGLCLHLRGKDYTSYATIGLGIERINIPCEELYSSEMAGKAFVKLSGVIGPGSRLADENLCYWAFPLDAESPWSALALLGDSNSPFFNPELLSLIIRGAPEIFSPQIDKILVRKTPDPAPKSGSDISGPLEAAIVQYNKINAQFNGIVLDPPAGMAEEQAEDFNKMLYNMVALLGITMVLPSSHSLILLPGTLDKELIAHRLSRSLNARALMVFEAKSSGEALDLIRSYL
jgi:hypothetical protein